MASHLKRHGMEDSADEHHRLHKPRRRLKPPSNLSRPPSQQGRLLSASVFASHTYGAPNLTAEDPHMSASYHHNTTIPSPIVVNSINGSITAPNMQSLNTNRSEQSDNYALSGVGYDESERGNHSGRLTRLRGTESHSSAVPSSFTRPSSISHTSVPPTSTYLSQMGHSDIFLGNQAKPTHKYGSRSMALDNNLLERHDNLEDVTRSGTHSETFHSNASLDPRIHTRMLGYGQATRLQAHVQTPFSQSYDTPGHTMVPSLPNQHASFAFSSMNAPHVNESADLYADRSVDYEDIPSSTAPSVCRKPEPASFNVTADPFYCRFHGKVYISKGVLKKHIKEKHPGTTLKGGMPLPPGMDVVDVIWRDHAERHRSDEETYKRGIMHHLALILDLAPPRLGKEEYRKLATEAQDAASEMASETAGSYAMPGSNFSHSATNRHYAPHIANRIEIPPRMMQPQNHDSTIALLQNRIHDIGVNTGSQAPINTVDEHTILPYLDSQHMDQFDGNRYNDNSISKPLGGVQEPLLDMTHRLDYIAETSYEYPNHLEFP